jgi:hypothetical protein
MALGKLPKAIAAGAARQLRRQSGGVAPATTPASIVRKLIPVRPVLPVAASPVAGNAVSKVAPVFGAQRLTAMRAVQAQRDKSRARAVEAGPREGLRAFGREVRAGKIAKQAATVRMTRQNPASPQADLNTGRLRYTGAFSSSPFKAPFQKSYNARRSFGA